ncbi:flagellar basal body L-ring protein FlgH [Buchnera aphidicola]|uniref:flagellar basal body L-ring protein FlgH n=1 Tax=Buchnera aphidicola TaxID=9 RepID=UPI0031B71150
MFFLFFIDNYFSLKKIDKKTKYIPNTNLFYIIHFNKKKCFYFKKDIYLTNNNHYSIFEKNQPNYSIGDTLIMIMEENIIVGKNSILNVVENNNYNTELKATGLSYFFEKLFKKNKINFNQFKKNELLTKKKFLKNNSFTSAITVTIKKIEPNGNLNFIGKKEIVINKHKEILYVSGTIDPKNISSKKKINSVHVANLHIKYFEHKENNQKKYNWFKKIFFFLKK